MKEAESNRSNFNFSNYDGDHSKEDLAIYFGLTSPLYGFVSGIILPVIIFNNTITNLLLILFCKNLSPRNHARVLYIIIAIADLLPTLHHFLLHVFLSDGLDYLTGGEFSIGINNISNAVCRFNWFLFGVSLQFCNWLLILFSLERLIVVFFPLRAMYFNVKTSLFGVLAIFALSAGYHLTFINTHNTVPDTLHEGEAECFGSDDSFSLTLFTVNFIGVYFLFPGLVNALGNIILLIKLKHISHQRMKMLGENQQQKSQIDLVTTITHITMSFIHFALVVPVVLIGIYTRILYAQKEGNEKLLDEIVNIFSSLLALSNISNGTSFYVYLARIKNFRISILSSFCCKFRTSQASSSKVSENI